MKDNGSPIGGSLRRELYAAYADYLVKYLQEMKAAGITIDALTIQNEPLNAKNNPSMSMTAAEQTVFLRDYLGPALSQARLPVNVLLYDHNANHIEYPLEVLADPAAARYAAGTAFHLYEGEVADLTKVHDAHPDKDLYFTEQALIAPSDFAADLDWHTDTVVIGAPRNWCRTALEWNLASAPGELPHTDQGGCIGCLGAVTLDGDSVTRNVSYYLIAHASKFVRPGAVRIASDEPAGLHNVAYRTADGRYVLVALNAGKAPLSFGIRQGGRTFAARLDAGAVGTVVWR